MGIRRDTEKLTLSQTLLFGIFLLGDSLAVSLNVKHVVSPYDLAILQLDKTPHAHTSLYGEMKHHAQQ